MQRAGLNPIGESPVALTADGTGLVGPGGEDLGGIVARVKILAGVLNIAADVNATIDKVSAAGGGVVELPAGQFKAAGIIMKSNVWLRGQGIGVTTLKIPDATSLTTGSPLDTSNIIFCRAATGDLFGFKISRMTLDGNRATQTEPNGFDNGLNCICVRGSGNSDNYYARNFVIEEVEAKEAVFHGIALYGGCRDFTVDRNHAHHNGYRSIHCHAFDGVGKDNYRYRITNNTSHNNGLSVGQNMQSAGYMNSGIFAILLNTFDAIVTGNNVYDEVGSGIDISGIDGVGGGTPSQFNIVANNTVSGCGDGITIAGNADCVIVANNTIRNSTRVGRVGGQSGGGIVCRSDGAMGGSNIKLQGNIISGCEAWGISCVNSTNKWKFMTITGNHIINNSRGSSAGVSYGGIFLQAADSCIVSGNIVRGNANAGLADRQIYTTTVTNSIIDGNVFDSSLKFDGSAYGTYPAADITSNGSGIVFTNNRTYRNNGGNGYNFAAANSLHFNNTGDKANAASFAATSTGARLNHDITTGTGSAAMGANCPAVTPTAPYAWAKVTTMDGSAGYVPVWK